MVVAESFLQDCNCLTVFCHIFLLSVFAGDNFRGNSGKLKHLGLTETHKFYRKKTWGKEWGETLPCRHILTLPFNELPLPRFLLSVHKDIPSQRGGPMCLLNRPKSRYCRRQDSIWTKDKPLFGLMADANMKTKVKRVQTLNWETGYDTGENCDKYGVA